METDIVVVWVSMFLICRFLNFFLVFLHSLLNNLSLLLLLLFLVCQFGTI